jgi:hypothetical protein
LQELDLTQDQKPELEEVEGGVIQLDPAEDASEGLSELEAEIEATAEGFSVRGFKCTKCGLAHGHDTDKHRASDTFAMTHDEAGQMDFNPNCHCGAHALAHGRGPNSVNRSEARATADSAPVPESVQQELR